jgi:hypothetical protein
MKAQSQILDLINSLTDDDDLRQELWVRHLSGSTEESLRKHVDRSLDNIDDENFKMALWNVISNPPSDNFNQLLEAFTDFERSIVILLALGLSIEKISIYKDISEIRVRQAISVIRYNNVWKKIYGIENATY